MKFDVLVALGLLAFFLNVAYRRGKDRKDSLEKVKNTYHF